MWVESELGHGSIFSFTLPLLSLPKLLLPAVTHNGELRSDISLIAVELTPRVMPGIGDWNAVRQACAELLRLCTLPDKDVVLPALDTDQLETLVIVAAADAYGANILADRIREQLRRYNDLNAMATFHVSTVPVSLPSPEDQPSIEKVVQEIADSISQMLMGAVLRQRRSSPGNDVAVLSN